jgi:hypothetical protein
MIPPVGPFKVEKSKDKEQTKRRYFHIKGKIEKVVKDGDKYVITFTSEEPSFKIEGIEGEKALLSNL